jgi:hypothetical protein
MKAKYILFILVIKVLIAYIVGFERSNVNILGVNIPIEGLTISSAVLACLCLYFLFKVSKDMVFTGKETIYEFIAWATACAACVLFVRFIIGFKADTGWWIGGIILSVLISLAAFAVTLLRGDYTCGYNAKRRIAH